MRARIGDLAIAHFDAEIPGNVVDAYLCFVTGIEQLSKWFTFIYWEKNGRNICVKNGCLPKSRLFRVRPRKNWVHHHGIVASWLHGLNLSNLTLDDVEVIQ